MALNFGRGRDGEDDVTTRPVSTAGAAAGGLTAFIDQGSEFEGKLSFRDTVRIDGRFRGEIEATIRSNTVAISGSVDGDVHAARKVVLHKTARVTGNITTPCLMVEEGAVVNGTFKMTSPDAKPGGTLKAVPGGAKPEAAKPPLSGPKPV